jgi:large subunit ribosomal protein L21
MKRLKMYAVIASGGKQYRVSQGEKVRVEKLDGTVGTKVVFDRVLMVGAGDGSKIGTPTVEGAKVEAEILSQGRAKKIVVFKFKRRKKFRKKAGHRQPYTELKVTEIFG